MNITALRSLFKINSNILKNSCKPFSFKFEITPANRLAEQEEAKPAADEEKPATIFRYQVCQPRTSPVNRPDITDLSQKQVKAIIAEQHLQPSMMPEYYQKQMDKSALVNPNSEGTEQDKITQMQHKTHNQRRFLESKTYANAILPLKAVKLANPFPEPVKMMISRTVSDEEKAEQMLAESRSQRNYSDWANKSPNMRPFSTDVKRYYSKKAAKSVGTDPSKCKKLKKEEKKAGCPKLALANCPPRARKRCLRSVPESHCKKQEAPYPAYSEYCHEDLDLKPSECRLCPWKLEDNPNFKPSKKKLHTSSAPLLIKRTGLEVDSNEQKSVSTTEVPEGMQCDLRKPPCEKPKNRKCPQPKAKKEKKKKDKMKDKKPKKMAEAFDAEIASVTEVQNILSLREAPKEKKNPVCKIKKFKFPPCKEEKKQEEVEKKEGGCPSRKKKRKIPDCPPTEEGGERKCAGIEGVMTDFELENLEMRLDDKKKTSTGNKKKEEIDPDPCKRKRKGNTLICPADVMHKKKVPRDKKKRRKDSGGTSKQSVPEMRHPSKTE